jgi:hypothetical protein
MTSSCVGRKGVQDSWGGRLSESVPQELTPTELQRDIPDQPTTSNVSELSQ